MENKILAVFDVSLLFDRISLLSPAISEMALLTTVAYLSPNLAPLGINTTAECLLQIKDVLLFAAVKLYNPKFPGEYILSLLGHQDCFYYSLGSVRLDFNFVLKSVLIFVKVVVGC